MLTAAAAVIAVLTLVQSEQAEVRPLLLFDCTTSSNSRADISAIGGQRFRWFGQSADPESERTGKIDVARLLAEVEKSMREGPFKWGMLDYENPFDSWMDMPSDSERHLQARTETLRALRAVRAAYPSVKWTCYGIPRLDHWPAGPDGTRVGWNGRRGKAQEAEIQRRVDAYAAIVAELDWISPAFYDYYENARMADPVGQSMVASEKLWRTESIKLARAIRTKLGLPPVPIIPCISPFFQPGGKATVLGVISGPELLDDQIEPSIASGVDGFAIWTAADYFSRVATTPTEGLPAGSARKDQQEARLAWSALAGPAGTSIDWGDDATKLRLSQRIGQIILDAARMAGEALKRKPDPGQAR
jgi:hypothetical protein